jgi:hypothetical protein
LSLLLAAGAAVFAAIFRLAAAGHILAAAIRREDGCSSNKQRDYQTEHYDYFLHFNSPFSQIWDSRTDMKPRNLDQIRRTRKRR